MVQMNKAVALFDFVLHVLESVVDNKVGHFLFVASARNKLNKKLKGKRS